MCRSLKKKERKKRKFARKSRTTELFFFFTKNFYTIYMYKLMTGWALYAMSFTYSCRLILSNLYWVWRVWSFPRNQKNVRMVIVEQFTDLTWNDSSPFFTHLTSRFGSDQVTRIKRCCLCKDKNGVVYNLQVSWL